MNAVCLRCDWQGEAGGTCPRCGAPIYRPVDPGSPRRAAARATGERVEAEQPAEPSTTALRAPRERDEAGWMAEPVRRTTSLRAVVAVAATAFGIVLVLLLRGGPDPLDPPGVLASPSPAGLPNGILVYAAPAGEGAARLWLWDLVANEVRRGPLVPEPISLHNVGSPGYGWIGVTAAAPDGGREAAVLDLLDAAARADLIGSADAVSWTREGATTVLVDQSPAAGGCRREVRVVAVHVDVEGSEVLLDDEVCGEVVSVGRTSLGYFATRLRPGGADIVGLGYRDAGVVLEGHALLGISPGGEMLVTPGRGVPGQSEAPDGAPSDVTGPALLFEQFGGDPVPYVVRGDAFTIHRILAYGPGSVEALVLGRPRGEDPGVWWIPLRATDERSLEPIRLGSADGSTAAAYAADGTAFVLSGVRLWVVRDDRLMPLDLPEGAPFPRGPIVWVLREPLTEL